MTEESDPFYCFYHNAIEATEPNANAIVCGECGHIYSDEADLRRQDWLEWQSTTGADFSCPFCVHDW